MNRKQSVTSPKRLAANVKKISKTLRCCDPAVLKGMQGTDTSCLIPLRDAVVLSEGASRPPPGPIVMFANQTVRRLLVSMSLRPLNTLCAGWENPRQDNAPARAPGPCRPPWTSANKPEVTLRAGIDHGGHFAGRFQSRRSLCGQASITEVTLWAGFDPRDHFADGF